MFKEIRAICRESRVALATSRAAFRSVEKLKELSQAQSEKVRATFKTLEEAHRKFAAYPTNFWKRFIRWLFASSLMKKVDLQIKALKPFKEMEPAKPKVDRTEFEDLQREFKEKGKYLGSLHDHKAKLEQVILDVSKIDWSLVPPEKKDLIEAPIEKLKKEMQELEEQFEIYENLKRRVERLAAVLQQ